MESTSMTNMDEGTMSMLPPATGSAHINVSPAERVISTFLGAAGTVYGLRNVGSLGGLTLLAAGGMLLYRGLTGYCSVNNAIGRNSATQARTTSAMEISGTFNINRSRTDVYNFWRKLENLPLFMKHLESVVEEDSVNSTWRARVPGNVGTVSWRATITEDRPQELLRWASQPGSTIDTAGEVRFEEAATGNGTTIKVLMNYRMPGGDLGTLAGKLFNPAVERMMKEDLMRFKSIIENGESVLAGGSASTSSGSQQDSDADLQKPRKTRARKSPDASLNTGTSRDTTLQSSPTNDINQPTEQHLADPDGEFESWDKHR